MPTAQFLWTRRMPRALSCQLANRVAEESPLQRGSPTAVRLAAGTGQGTKVVRTACMVAAFTILDAIAGMMIP